MRRSAPITWDQVRVGIVLIVALTILAAGIFFVGEMGAVFGDRYRLVTLMNSAAGLVQGAVVQVAGQPVGQVDEIEFIEPDRRPETGEAVAIWMAVDRKVQNLIRTDSKARVRTQGLLGDRLIDISPGSAENPVLQPGDTLPAAEALNYQELLDRASDAVTGLTTLVRNLSDITEGLLAGEGTMGQLVVDEALYRRLVSLSGSLDRFLTGAVGGEGFLGRALRDDELYDRLVSAVASLDSLTERVVAGEGTMGRLVRSDSLYVALTEMAVRSDSLLRSLQEGRGSLGSLIVDDRLYEELLKTVADLNATLEDLRQQPRKYIPPVEVF